VQTDVPDGLGPPFRREHFAWLRLVGIQTMSRGSRPMAERRSSMVFVPSMIRRAYSGLMERMTALLTYLR